MRLAVTKALPPGEDALAALDVCKVDKIPTGKLMHGHIDGALGVQREARVGEERLAPQGSMP